MNLLCNNNRIESLLLVEYRYGASLLNVITIELKDVTPHTVHEDIDYDVITIELKEYILGPGLCFGRSLDM